MPPRLRLFYSLLTGALLLIPIVALYSELSKRSDIWWTPATNPLSLNESKDRVEIYVRGRPLGTLLEQGRISVTDSAGSHVLNAQEIAVRLNNWDRMRIERLPLLLFYAAACGAGVIVLLVVATGRLAYRGELPPVSPTIVSHR